MNRDLQLHLTPSVVIGLLGLGASKRLPVEIWQCESALELVDKRAAPSSKIGRALHRWPQQMTIAGRGYIGVAGTIRELAALGAVIPSGQGVDAHYSLTAGWAEQLTAIYNGLTPTDREALRAGSQLLKDRSRRVSNTLEASGSRG